MQNLDYERDIKYYSTFSSSLKMGNLIRIDERLKFIAEYYKAPEPGLAKEI